MTAEKLLYLDCASGIAGDMLLSALIDLGLNIRALENLLKNALKYRAWHIHSSKIQKNHFPAYLLSIEGAQKYMGGKKTLTQCISQSTLPNRVKEKSLKALELLCKAEYNVHGKLPQKHTHTEEGLFSLDTLIDITANIWGVEKLGIASVIASPINVGLGAPATLEIAKLCHLPIWASGEPLELTTPTGAALVSILADEFGPCPIMTIENSGFGAGQQHREKAPNVVRAYFGSSCPHPNGRR